ncbi:MAG: hypothetical protein WA666_04685 [Nitrospirota bacterium]
MIRLIIISMAILILSTSIVNAEQKVKITGTFSDLYYNEEGGDLLGNEIRIVVGRDGYEGTFQASEGAPDRLILIKPIQVTGNEIKFSIPENSLYAGDFVGKISETELTGTLTLKNGNKIKMILKRGKSYWD